MRAYDIIERKKRGSELSKEEIDFFIDGYVKGSIMDYQASALLMAICLKGMNEEEATYLTEAITASGHTVDLSEISGIKVDKHSTGGVGDKTTLVVAPIVAAAGLKVAKISGRGLGYTGGTLDKLESIPGMKVALEEQEFFDIVNTVGMSVISQSENIAYADKKLSALRDVTATVDSLPLIASSIMGKKLASGSDCILLDVKVGSGAFMKTYDDALKLAELMVKIGNNAGRKTVALITDMDTPLGRNIGNSLEVIEALEILKGGGPSDLRELSVEIGAHMISAAEEIPLPDARKMAGKTIEDGSAFKVFRDFVKAQQGDVKYIDNTDLFEKGKFVSEIKAEKEGYIHGIDAEECGKASMILGAGREKKGDSIDYAAGICLLKKTGEKVKTGEPVARLYTNRKEALKEAENIVKRAFIIDNCPANMRSILFSAVIGDEVIDY